MIHLRRNVTACPPCHLLVYKFSWQLAAACPTAGDPASWSAKRRPEGADVADCDFDGHPAGGVLHDTATSMRVG